MNRLLAVFFVIALLNAVCGQRSFAVAANDTVQIKQGQAIAEANCARCHAVGPDDESVVASAPAFRELGLRYPVDTLAEGLAEGIVTGHPAMPEFELQPEDIEAFLAYLNSIQVK